VGQHVRIDEYVRRSYTLWSVSIGMTASSLRRTNDRARLADQHVALSPLRMMISVERLDIRHSSGTPPARQKGYLPVEARRVQPTLREQLSARDGCLLRQRLLWAQAMANSSCSAACNSNPCGSGDGSRHIAKSNVPSLMLSSRLSMVDFVHIDCCAGCKAQ